MEFYLACIEVAKKTEKVLTREMLENLVNQDFFDPFADHYLITIWIESNCLPRDSYLYKVFCAVGITDRDDMSRLLLEFTWFYLRLKRLDLGEEKTPAE